MEINIENTIVLCEPCVENIVFKKNKCNEKDYRYYNHIDIDVCIWRSRAIKRGKYNCIN